MAVINFRYHVVSLTAVFLALAVGLVLGSTVLNGPMLDALESRVNTLGRDNSQLREQVSHLEEEVDREQDFATESAPMLLADQLTGRRVTMLVLPGGEEYAEGVGEALALADATVTGTVVLTDKFTHPQHRLSELLDVAHRALPPSIAAGSLPANSDGVETSAALIAAVLLDGGATATGTGEDAEGEPDQNGEADPADGEPAVSLGSGTAVPSDERGALLAAYANLDYLEQEGTVTGPAELVVVVAGLPDAESDADQRNEAMLTTVVQFSTVGQVVVAANGVAGDGNLVAEVRGDPQLSEQISTVDNASAPQGQVATGLAVAEHLAGQAGHYGNGGGADRLLPDPSAR
jgi:hypothetical protein